jgi:nucleoside-triphosphatase THEP1
VNGRVILVTGGRHCGKTTLVEKLLGSGVGQGKRIAGILARGLWQDDRRAGFDLVNLTDGSVTPLARRRRHPDPGCRVMFDFFDEGWRAGARALNPDVCGKADIVVVDEVGKLEARGEGWASHIHTLLALDGPLLLLICRLDCLPRIREGFGLQKAPAIDAQAPRALHGLSLAVKRILPTYGKAPGA